MKYPYTSWFQSTAILPYLPLIALTILGALLRFHELGKQPIWIDEAATLRFAQLSFSQLWSDATAWETNPPLYYTLQKIWLVFGHSEAALRSLSAIIGTITIPLIYGLGRTLGGHWLGLISAALLATSKINIQYSQEARTYVLLTASVTLSIWGLAYLLTNSGAIVPIGQGLIHRLNHDYVNTKTNRNNLASDLAWLAYIFGVSVSLYCHNTAVLLIISANIVAFVWWTTQGRFNKKFFFNWSIANVIPLLIWSWWIPKILKQTAVTLSNFWIPEPTIRNFIRTLVYLYSHKYDLPVIIVLAILGVWYWRHQPSKIALTITLSIGTVVLGFLISLWRPIFISRIFLWTTIPFFVLLAAGFLNLRKKSLMAISLSIILIVQLITVRNYYQYYKKEPWNQVAAYVQSLVKSDDMILLLPSGVEMPFQYYFQPSQPITQYGIQQARYEQLKPIDPKIARITKATEISRSQLLNKIQEFKRIWLVVRNRKLVKSSALVISDLSQNMTKLAQRRFDNLEVFLFEKVKKPGV